MDMGQRSDGIAAIDVSEIQEWLAGTYRVRGADGTLVEVDRTCVEVGGRSAVGNGQQFQVVESLLYTAAVPVGVAAVDDATVADLMPRRAAVLSLPNALII